MELNEFLMWVANSGGAIAIVSWAFERWPWYQTLGSDAKQWAFFGMSLGVTILAYLVLTYVPAEVLQGVAPYFMFAYATFTTVFAGQLFHKADKK